MYELYLADLPVAKIAILLLVFFVITHQKRNHHPGYSFGDHAPPHSYEQKSSPPVAVLADDHPELICTSTLKNRGF